MPTKNDDEYVRIGRLVLDAKGGDTSARNELFERFRQPLRRMVALRLDRRLQGRVDPSDVLQEAFINYSRRIEEYSDSQPEYFFVWLRTLAAQTLIDLHREHLGTIVLGNVTDPTHATVAPWNNDVATFSSGKINWSDGSVWTLTTAAAPHFTVVDYVNPANNGATHIFQNGTSVLGFVNEQGQIVLGSVTNATHATVAAWNNDVATFSSGKINWSDGSAWTLTNSPPGQLTVTDDINSANGGTVHVIENGTATVVFVNEQGQILLGNLNDPTHALVPAWGNDLATIGASAIHWSDGSVWKLL